MLEAYRAHVAERATQNIPAKPLDPEWTAGLLELLKNPPAGEEEFLLDLIANRVPPGVDEAAYVKAGFLSAIVNGEASSPLIDRSAAVTLLGNMHGGYNVATLVALLDDVAVLHHQDGVGVADGREPVGDDDGGPAGHQPSPKRMNRRRNA